jgi:drug/metabolite transporter (DMT)-like permease
MKFFVKSLNILGIVVVVLSWVMANWPYDADNSQGWLLSPSPRLAIPCAFIGSVMIVFAANLKRKTQEASKTKMGSGKVPE